MSTSRNGSKASWIFFSIAFALSQLRVSTAQLPEWPQSWAMNQSTIMMVCNYTGFVRPDITAKWTIVDYDWSNSKGTGDADGWAKHKPMDCEEMMVEQVNILVSQSPQSKAMVYRNAVKALPWLTSVRVKLEDPAYHSWFLKFGAPTVGNGWHVPQCDNNYSPPLCTDLYHDQGQTPGYPSGDGNCAAPACDVGNIPVGEYLFDFRSVNVSVNNQTFAEWYVDDYHFGPSGAGNSNIAGFYVDDSWGPNGPTEMDGNCVKDMGLSSSDISDITDGYNYVTQILYARILSSKKFIWDQFLNHDPFAPLNGDCPQPWVHQASCASDLRSLCTPTAQPQTRALLYGFSPGSCTGVNPADLKEVDQDIANFLLIRGSYAYLGIGWVGCSQEYEYPSQFNEDYGDAIGICSETSPGSGIFTREFTKSTVQMNCSSYVPTITWK